MEDQTWANGANPLKFWNVTDTIYNFTEMKFSSFLFWPQNKRQFNIVSKFKIGENQTFCLWIKFVMF